MTDKKLLLALKHREISLMSYRLDVRKDKEKVAKVNNLLVSLRKNIATREAAQQRVKSDSANAHEKQGS